MTTVGSGKYTYQLVQDWPKLPDGMTLGAVSAIATDSQDRVYIFHREDPPVVVCDRDGNYLNGWGKRGICLRPRLLHCQRRRLPNRPG